MSANSYGRRPIPMFLTMPFMHDPVYIGMFMCCTWKKGTGILIEKGSTSAARVAYMYVNVVSIKPDQNLCSKEIVTLSAAWASFSLGPHQNNSCQTRGVFCLAFARFPVITYLAKITPNIIKRALPISTRTQEKKIHRTIPLSKHIIEC